MHTGGRLITPKLMTPIFKVESIEYHHLPSDIDESFWGKHAENVRQQYEQKKPALRIIREKLRSGNIWRTFCDAAKQQVRSPSEIKKCLETAGAAHTFADIGCSRERLLAAVLHMHEIRKRPTIVDLAWMVGILPDAADEIIDTWLTS